MSNSAMVVYTKISPNQSGKRTHSIDRITPHCVVGQCTAESLGDWFYKSSTEASSNYGIDKDGRVGMYVEEDCRSWCSSSRANDQRAVTIECASDTYAPYAFRDVVYERLIELCADICRRNGKTKLLWFGDKDKTLDYEPKEGEMVLTVHQWFAATACPGDWMMKRMGDLAEKVTKELAPAPEYPECPFAVNVKTTGINVRKAPDMSGAILGTIDKGCHTILEVKDGWGKLKDDAGWFWIANPDWVDIEKPVTFK